MPTDHEIRSAILSYVAEDIRRNGDGANLQTGAMLSAVGNSLAARGNPIVGRAILDQTHELFRTGYFAWGFNLSNPDSPFFHVTGRGVRALERLSRDPANPDGYIAYLRANVEISPIALSYLSEALACYTGENYKAAAVMTGASAESLALELRNLLVSKLEAASRNVPRDLSDWKITKILGGLGGYFERHSGDMQPSLRDGVAAYWPSYFQFIRSARNEAGHPTSVDPITPEMAHAALLMFPELARLAQNLREWIEVHQIS